MNSPRMIALTIGLILTVAVTITTRSTAPESLASPGTPFETCSCSAPDGSCEASVTCRGGCTQFCGNNDNCSASCSGGLEYLAMEVTFETQISNYSQVVRELSRLSGKELVFTPSVPSQVFNLGFKKATLWDALSLLSDQGSVRINGQDFERLKKLRRSLLAGEKVTFGVHHTTLNTFVNDLASLIGRPLRITNGSPMANLDLQLQDATLNEILAATSESTGSKISE